MTRIIAGIAKGRTLKVPGAGTRPTSDRVRESVFNILQHELESWNGKRILDLYAGSGAFALESLSRGASTAVAVEKSKPAADIIKLNAQQLHMNIECVTRDAKKFVEETTDTFDVVFLDPPYDVDNETITLLLTQLSERGIVAEDGVIVVERSARDEVFSMPDSLTIHSDRTLGETRVLVLLR